LFKNETNREPYKLVLPGCSFRCPLEQFSELTEPIIPKNWIEECKLTSEQVYSSTKQARFMQVLSTSGNIIFFSINIAFQEYLFAVVIGSGIIVLLLLSILVLAISFVKQRNRNNFIYSPLDQMYG
jgi:hypothetical protein